MKGSHGKPSCQAQDWTQFNQTTVAAGNRKPEVHFPWLLQPLQGDGIPLDLPITEEKARTGCL